jgi:putative SOS response-associated peptidase YedK
MCNYNGRYVSRAEFIRLKNLEKQLDALAVPGKSVSGFDYTDWPVIKPIMNGADWKFATMEWGFLPDSWFGKKLDTREKVMQWRKGYKDPNKGWIPGITTLNAKGEELLFPGKIYNESAILRRCIIPSPGFYESRHLPKIGKKGEPLKATETYPYRIFPKDGKPFLMAGVWKTWKDQETNEEVETFAIVTTAANKLMEQIHNTKKRQPTILTEELAEEWLFGDLSEERITEIATYQAPPEVMDYYTIQKKFWTYPLEQVDERFEFTGLPEIVL